MAVTQSALAHQMARQVVRTAPADANIRRIWVWSQHGYIDPERDYVHIWVLADPISPAADDALLTTLNDLPERFPDVNIGAGTFAPGDYTEEELRDWMHPDAEEIDLGIR
ncbi:MAG: hypothetical protein U0893_26410 [Chloroflexota bacterium]